LQGGTGVGQAALAGAQQAVGLVQPRVRRGAVVERDQAERSQAGGVGLEGQRARLLEQAGQLAVRVEEVEGGDVAVAAVWRQSAQPAGR
jgi:hypothetical protein